MASCRKGCALDKMKTIAFVEQLYIIKKVLKHLNM